VRLSLDDQVFDIEAELGRVIPHGFFTSGSALAQAILQLAGRYAEFLGIEEDGVHDRDLAVVGLGPRQGFRQRRPAVLRVIEAEYDVLISSQCEPPPLLKTIPTPKPAVTDTPMAARP